jgi:hypothetical protein
VNPVLALGLLGVAGLLAARLPRPPLLARRPAHPSLELLVAAGAPLVLLGLVLGPGIDLLDRAVLRALAPVTAFAIGGIGAGLGARCEWRCVRRVPRGAWLAAAATTGTALLLVSLGAWVLARLVPGLAAAWTPRGPALLGLGAVAAVSAPAVVTALARATGVRPRVVRVLRRAAALETAWGVLAMTVPLALARPRLAAGNVALGWLSAVVFAIGSGALVGLVFLGLTRRDGPREDLGLVLLGTLLFGAGIGYATDLSPFVVCALAAVVIVNASPRRRETRAVLARWERALYTVCLCVAGALLALPTLWLLVAAPLLGVLRALARWASGHYARAAVGLRDLPPHVGLATVAQGGAAVALGVNYVLGAGGRAESLSAGGAGGAGSAVLATIVLGVGVAQLVARPLMTLALRPVGGVGAGAAPVALTPAPTRTELTATPPADRAST